MKTLIATLLLLSSWSAMGQTPSNDEITPQDAVEFLLKACREFPNNYSNPQLYPIESKMDTIYIKDSCLYFFYWDKYCPSDGKGGCSTRYVYTFTKLYLPNLYYKEGIRPYASRKGDYVTINIKGGELAPDEYSFLYKPYRPNSMIRYPDAKYGYRIYIDAVLLGLEKGCNNKLAGTEGEIRVEVNNYKIDKKTGEKIASDGGTIINSKIKYEDFFCLTCKFLGGNDYSGKFVRENYKDRVDKAIKFLVSYYGGGKKKVDSNNKF